MVWLVSFLVFALLFQVVLFIMIRKKKNEMKQSDILSRYNINSRADLFKILASRDLDEADRVKLQALYDGEDEATRSA